jgi:hypothetical protein
MASDRQIEANRANGKKAARKPRDTRLSRSNATDHGLLAVGVTAIDNADFFLGLLNQLQEEWKPEGEVEKFLVERIALSMLRVRRSVRLESEAITAELFPVRRSKSRTEEQLEQYLATAGASTTTIDPGFQVQLQHETVGNLAELFGRYETLHERRLFRAIEYLEHLQMTRRTRFTSGPAVAPAPNA